MTGSVGLGENMGTFGLHWLVSRATVTYIRIEGLCPSKEGNSYGGIVAIGTVHVTTNCGNNVGG